MRADYETALGDLGTQQQQFLATVSSLEEALEEKLGKLFSSQELEREGNVDTLDLANVVKALNRHNELSAGLASKRQEAARRVEQVRIADVRELYSELTETLEGLEKEKTTLEKERRQAGEELQRLSHDGFDPRPLAEKLNKDLARLLGRDDLKFVVAGAGYRIERTGNPAVHLSEGERNAISLLYFLCSLSSHGTTASDSIVVIDDPVSSLDGNALVGASAHLWSELVGAGKCRQVVLLTHNFELFRMWSSQLDHNSHRLGQSHQTFELRTRVIREGIGDLVRQPSLLAWPTDQRLRDRLRSEYHYLFWRVADMLIECRAMPSPQGDVEAATVMPNVCRRLLEGFLGFKSPENVGNLHSQIMGAGGDRINEAVRSRIYRFVQMYSHNPEADTTRPVGRPEAVEILNAVLEFMREVDPEHFAAMCKAVDIDTEQLEAAVIPPEATPSEP